MSDPVAAADPPATAGRYPYLPPGWATVEVPDGIVILAGASASLLEGRGAATLVARLLPRLDGQGSVREIAAGLAGVSPGELVSLLEALVAAGVVREATEPGPATEGVVRRLAAATATVAGHELLVAPCAAALRRAGLARIEAIDRPGDLTVSLAAGGARAELTCFVADGEAMVTTGCPACARLRRLANSALATGVTAQAVDPATLYHLAAALAGTVACATLDADAARHDGRVLVLDAATLEISRHRALPVPGCPTCGGPPSDARTPDPSAPLADATALAALAALVDRRTGVIHEIAVEAGGGDRPAAPFVATALAAAAPDGARPPRPMPAGWGKGMTPQGAVLSAAGEALERYAASMPDRRRIRQARLADLAPGEVLNPRLCPLYSAAQYERPDFPFVRFDPDIPHPWIAGRMLGFDAPVWIPAVFAFLALPLDPRQNFCSGTSNGLAAHSDGPRAAVSAILELVERDAFLASWRTQTPGRPVPIDGGWDADLLAVVRGIEGLGGEVEVCLLPSACGYPAAACLAFGDGQAWPGVTLGLGADPDARAAIRQAVLELGQTGPYLRRLLRSGRPIPDRPEAVREMLDHAAYYFPPSRAAAFAYLRGGPPLSYRDLEPGPERGLDACAAALREHGVRLALVDVTSADLQDTPFRVVRAVSPDLQPISFGHGLDRASVPRVAAREVALPPDYVSPIW